MAAPTSVGTPATAAVTTRPVRRASTLIAMEMATGEFDVGNGGTALLSCYKLFSIGCLAHSFC